MKIKVFKFLVSNWTSKNSDDDIGKRDYSIARARLSEPSTIEKTINEFCKNKDIIDIKINSIDVGYHNNGRGNLIELWYTIMYKEA